MKEETKLIKKLSKILKPYCEESNYISKEDIK